MSAHGHTCLFSDILDKEFEQEESASKCKACEAERAAFEAAIVAIPPSVNAAIGECLQLLSKQKCDIFAPFDERRMQFLSDWIGKQ